MRITALLLATLLLAITVEGDASTKTVKKIAVKVVAQEGQHLQGVRKWLRKVRFGAVGAAAIGALQFAPPASADLKDLSTKTELVQTRRAHSAIFAAKNTKKIAQLDGNGHDEDGFSGSWHLSKGYLYEQSEHLGLYGAGYTGTASNFEFYLENELLYSESPEAANDMRINNRLNLGGSLLLYPYKHEGEPSFGYSSVALLVGSNMQVEQLRNYLLHYTLPSDTHEMQVAALGHEYYDTSYNIEHTAEQGEEQGKGHAEEHVEEMMDIRGHNLALYRAALIIKIPTSMDELDIELKLNTMLGLGFAVGRIWQEQLEDFAGEHELEHALFHKLGAGLKLVAADGALALSGGADYAHTIDGAIEAGEGEEGDFSIGRLAVVVGGEVELLPEYGIALEGEYAWTRQDVAASLAAAELDLNTDDHEVLVALVKSFE